MGVAKILEISDRFEYDEDVKGASEQLSVDQFIDLISKKFETNLRNVGTT